MLSRRAASDRTAPRIVCRARPLCADLITDEDDCSVQAMKRGLLNPATPSAASASCNPPAVNVDGQCYNLDYRCTALSLACNEPLNAPGRKTSCQERADSFLNSVDAYAKFFASLPNPNLVIAGIWTPTLLDNLASNPAKDGQLFVDYINGPQDSSGLNRGRQSNAACHNADPRLTSDPNGFFGQAQLRLSSFLRKFQPSITSESSICDADNYPGALSVIADNLLRTLPVDCLSKPPIVTDGRPECVVGYVDADNPHDTPAVLMPACSAKCCEYFATDPEPNSAHSQVLNPNPHLQAELLACSGEPDCYCAVPSKVSCGSGAVAGLWRKDNAPPPAGKIVNFQCAVAGGGV